MICPRDRRRFLIWMVDLDDHRAVAAVVRHPGRQPDAAAQALVDDFDPRIHAQRVPRRDGGDGQGVVATKSLTLAMTKLTTLSSPTIAAISLLLSMTGRRRRRDGRPPASPAFAVAEGLLIPRAADDVARGQDLRRFVVHSLSLPLVF